jgi:hypothetical protein
MRKGDFWVYCFFLGFNLLLTSWFYWDLCSFYLWIKRLNSYRFFEFFISRFTVRCSLHDTLIWWVQADWLTAFFPVFMTGLTMIWLSYRHHKAKP